jgi:PAS domain S-box-containing protein
MKEGRQQRQLEKLSNAVREIMGDLQAQSLDERLDLIVKHAAEVLDAETSSIFLLESEGVLSLRASYGHVEGTFQKGMQLRVRSGLHTGLTGHIAAEGKIFNAYGEYLINHLAVAGNQPEHLPSRRCHSLLAVPLRQKTDGSGMRLLGLIRVENKRDASGRSLPTLGFDEEDEWVVETFASFVVSALESAALVRELSEQREHLARLIDSSPSGGVAVDAHGRITMFNRRAETILGYRSEEILGRSSTLLYADPDEMRHLVRLVNDSPDGRVSDYETYARSKDGERIPIRQSTTLLVGSSGAHIGSVSHFEDLRWDKERERQLSLYLEATALAASAGELDDGLRRLARLIGSLLPHTFCRISLLEDGELKGKATYVSSRDASAEGDVGEAVVSFDAALRDEMAAALESRAPQLLRHGDEGARPLLESLSRLLGVDEVIQSLLLVPLVVEGHTVGLMELGEFRGWGRQPFTETEVRIATAIASEVASLVERVRLNEQTRRRELLLQALTRASLYITTEREPEKLLQQAVRLAVDLVGCRAGGLYVHQAARRRLRLEASFGFDVTPELHSLGYGGMLGRVALEGTHILVWNYDQTPDADEALLRYGFRAFAAIPLRSHLGDVEAVLFVADFAEGRRLDSAEMEVLGLFAAQVTAALQTARLLTEEQRFFTKHSTLYQISDYIRATNDFDKLVHVVLTGLTAGYGLGFNRAALLLMEHAGETLVGHMSVGHLDEQTARTSWEQERLSGTGDLKSYLSLLQGGDPPVTEVGVRVAGLCVPLGAEPDGIFARVVNTQKPFIFDRGEELALPELFVEAFGPGTPLVVVPLVARGEVIGLIVADNKFSLAPVTEGDLDLLMTLTNTAAFAIDNLRLLEGLQKATMAAGIFAEVSAVGDYDRTLAAIARGTISALGCDAVALYAYDEQRGVFTYPPAHAGLRYPHLAFTDRPTMPQDSLVYEALKRDDSYLARSVADDPLFAVSRFARVEEIKSCVLLPLKAAGQKVGVMFVNYRAPHRFTELELASIKLFANQAAVAIRNWQLFTAVVKRSAYLRALNEAGKAIAASLGGERKQTLDEIVRCLVNVTGTEGPKAILASLQLLDEQGAELGLESVHPPEHYPHMAARVGERRLLAGAADGRIGVTGRAVLTGRAQLIADVRLDPDYLEAIPGTVSELAVPLRDQGGRCIGVLNVESDQPSAFDAEDLLALEALAELAVVVLRNAEQYEELQRVSKRVDSSVGLALLGMVSSTWRHVIAGHAINIKNLVTLLRHDLAEKVPEAGAQEKLERRLQFIENLAQKIYERPMVPPLSSDREERPVDVRALVRERVRQLWDGESYSGVTLGLSGADEPLTARVSPEWFRHVLDIVLNNAVRAVNNSAREPAERRISIEAARASRRVEIIISDTGDGIPPEVLSNLFHAPIVAHRGHGGMGIGLLIAKLVMGTYGGDIRVLETGPGGTKILLTLPAADEERA